MLILIVKNAMSGLNPGTYLHGRFERLRGSLLCRRDTPITSAWAAIGWWEARRIPFNLIVGSAGILTSIVLGTVGLASWFLLDRDFGLPDPPLFAVFAVIIYGLAANLCFTGGWLAGLLIRKLWRHEADRFASLSLALGLVFSVLLTLTPGILVSAGGLFRLARYLFGIIRNH